MVRPERRRRAVRRTPARPVVGGACHDDGVTDSSPLAPIRLVVGEEELLRSRAIDEVVAAARAEDPECDVRRTPVGSLTAGELFELLSPSLFATRRVIVVLEAEQATKDLVAAITSYVADPADGIHLVVSHTGGGRAKALVTTLTKAGVVTVECPAVTRQEERLGFVRAEVRAHGGAIDARAAAALVDAVGNDLRDLASAAAQLVADTAGAIDSAAVARYHTGRAEVTGFAVADRAVVGETDQALEALRWAFTVGVADVLVADALADGVRSIARVFSAGRGNPYELASSLGMPPWKVKRAQQQARGWSEAGLRQAMGVVADLNAAVKGVAADPRYALEKAVRDIGVARASARGA